MHISDYPEAKQRGLVKLVRFAGKAMVISKQFSPVTGDPMPPSREDVDLDQLRRQVESLRREAESSQMLLDDFLAVEEFVPESPAGTESGRDKDAQMC